MFQAYLNALLVAVGANTEGVMLGDFHSTRLATRAPPAKVLQQVRNES